MTRKQSTPMTHTQELTRNNPSEWQGRQHSSYGTFALTWPTKCTFCICVSFEKGRSFFLCDGNNTRKLKFCCCCIVLVCFLLCPLPQVPVCFHPSLLFSPTAWHCKSCLPHDTLNLWPVELPVPLLHRAGVS